MRRKAGLGLPLALGAAIALALELGWPGRWQRGSTPRFAVTVVLGGLVILLLARRWRSR